MAFKQKPIVNVRLESMTKKELIKTVKTLRTRETKLLNRIDTLERTSGEDVVANLDAKLMNATKPFPWYSKQETE